MKHLALYVVKAGAYAIPVYIDGNGQIWVLTAIRTDKENKEYDGLIEIVAETKKLDESILETARRGVLEEDGPNAKIVHILGANGQPAIPEKYHTSDRYEQEIILPYCGFNSIGGNIQLISHCFIVVLAEKNYPPPNREAKYHTWWLAADLLILAREYPDCFSFTYGFMRRVLEDLDSRKLKINR